MRVFVSSTYSDLQEIRQRLFRALAKAGKLPEGMEFFGARPDLPVTVCLQELRRSDVAILMLGSRYGSVEPESGLSYTELEYREAIGCGIPVLAIALSSSAAIVSSAEAEDSGRLRTFRTEVLQGSATADLVDSQDEFPEAALAALMQFVDEQANRIGQFRTFQDPKDYFASQLDPAAIFNHTHILIGRDGLLSDLESFLDDPDVVIAVLPGPGGSGKSKLLYELSIRRKTRAPRMLFLGPQFALDEEKLKELPAGPLCIVVDDAHRLRSLEGIVRALASAGATRPMKLLISCRPMGLASIKHALRGLQEEAWHLLGEVPPLEPKRQALALAKASLGPQQGKHAARLVEVSDGNPLLITVGGRLIQDGDLHPDLLSHEEDFRTAALDGLLRDVPEHLAGTVPSQQLLEAMAGICPFRRGVENAEQLIADFLKVNRWDIGKAIAELDDKHRLILKRGRLIRIQPDVLADHLLYTACVAGGQATGFADAIVGAFGSSYLENALTNAAEVQWRCQVAGTAVSILGDIYRQIMADLPSLSHRERVQLLKALTKPSLFLPEESWKLVSWLIEHPDAPEDTDPIGRAFPHDQSHIVRELPPILARVGVHQQFTARCAIRLFRLAQEDARPTNPYPEHPMRTLQDMLEYQPGRPFDLQLKGLLGLKDFAERDAAKGQYVDLAEAVNPLFAREVTSTKSTGWGITMTTQSLHEELKLPQMTELRKQAHELLVAQGLCPDAKAAINALQAIAGLLCPPTGNFGRHVTDDERAAWLPEAEQAVKSIARIANETESDVVALRAHILLKKSLEREMWPDLSQAVERGVQQLKRRDTLDLYMSLMERWALFAGVSDHEQVERRYADLTKEQAERLWSCLRTPKRIVEQLGYALDALSSAGVISSCYAVLNELCALKSDQCADIAEAMMMSPSVVLRAGIWPALRHLLEQDPGDAFRIIHRALDRDDEALANSIAEGYWHRWMFCEEENQEAHLDVLERILSGPFDGAKRSAVDALRHAKGEYVRRALDLLVSVDFGEDTKMLDEALGVFHPKYGLDRDLLTDEDVKKLLTKLELVRDLSRNDYHISQFLDFTATRHPVQVVECLLNRVHRSVALAAEEREEQGLEDKYTPLPYTEFATELKGLSKSGEFLDVLRTVRDSILKPQWEYTFWIPKLFGLASSGVCTGSFPVLREWLESGDPKKIVGVTKLLEGANHTFVFDMPEFVAEVMLSAEGAGYDCYRSCVSHLHVLTFSGTYTSSPGKPAPRLVSAKNAAAEFARSYESQKPVADFYRGAAEHAEQQIRDNHIRDQEQLDE